jgi:hypothetical protein
LERLEISHHPFHNIYSSSYDFITSADLLVGRSLGRGISASENNSNKTGSIERKYIPNKPYLKVSSW